MEEVKRNVITFLEILQIGRTESITHWDESNFKRAQQWARYAEEVFNKLKDKPSLVQVLSNYVDQKQESSKVVTQNFLFTDLQCATENLRSILLHNPHLSSAQFSFVLEIYGVDLLSPSKSSLEGIISDTFHINCNKGIFLTLSNIRDELSNKSDRLQQLSNNKHRQSYDHVDDGLTDPCRFRKTTDVCLDVCGTFLWKNLRNMTLKQKDTALGERFILKKLKSIACHDKGMEVILRMLVVPMEGERSVTISNNNDIMYDSLKRHVFGWILECSRNDGNDFNAKLWSCPSTLLCEVSVMHNPFYKSYLNFLKSLGDSFLGSVSHENTCSYGSSYLDLIRRFQELMRGPKHTSEFCKHTLRSWSFDADTSSTTSFETISDVSVNLWTAIYKQACQ